MLTLIFNSSSSLLLPLPSRLPLPNPVPPPSHSPSRPPPQHVFLDWWGHNPAEEKRLFEGVVDWLCERRRRHPNMHIFHYAPYETEALKRLAARHATRYDWMMTTMRGILNE